MSECRLGLEGSWVRIYGRETKTVFQHHEVPENGEARTGRASLGRGKLKQVGIYLVFLVNNLLVNMLEYQLERCVVWIPMDGAC